ncbi:serine hydrolase [Acetivibrio cellulolyticus]|uniref:serine hydrolase n=1 Tax=Acetivibrio cellulolyticus TaxID=35830 RepID=UPI0001E2F59B|nr:serine hydrolase [Acetivibrio cellulolyticus]
MKMFRKAGAIFFACMVSLMSLTGCAQSNVEHTGHSHEEHGHEEDEHGGSVESSDQGETVYRFDSNGINASAIQEIETFIKQQMEVGKLPGISIAVVNGDKEIYSNGFGYSDLKSKEAVTTDTLFELGSVSKAFTGLAILKLEEEGKLKINDPVSKYIPWLKLKYNGKEVDVTLEQFLHQTSGIPFETACEIPVSDSEKALEYTVRVLINKELINEPGKNFFYASLNYDVLGLVIQQVSGVSYEEYMRNNILQLFGLNNTYMSREEAMDKGMSYGYKLGFTKVLRYDAPEYRGNTPAGYIISNAEDMGKWLGIQLGAASTTELQKSIIDKSHVHNSTVPKAEDGAFYAAGWAFYPDGYGEFIHDGGNPNFSSYISFSPGENLGIIVLANRNSVYTRAIGQGVMNILRSKDSAHSHFDNYLGLDKTVTVIFFVSSGILILVICLLAIAVMQLIKKRRSYSGSIIKKLLILIPSLTVIIIIGYNLYNAPNILFGGLPWGFINVWGPMSILPAVYSIFGMLILLGIFIVLTTLFPKSKAKT